MKNRETLVHEVRVACSARGLDLVAPFRLGWCQGVIEPTHELFAPLGRASACALLIGNTRALWPALCKAAEVDMELRGARDPVDRYVERTLESALAGMGLDHVIAWAHRYHPAVVPIQRIAHAIGFAHLGPAHLSIHAEFGPWLAFRAVVVLDVPGPDGEAPIAWNPCAGCQAPCSQALERAARTGLRVEEAWERWVEVRDSCPQGRDRRYTEAQLRYHYTKAPWPPAPLATTE